MCRKDLIPHRSESLRLFHGVLDGRFSPESLVSHASYPFSFLHAPMKSSM